MYVGNCVCNKMYVGNFNVVVQLSTKVGVKCYCAFRE